MMPCILVSLIQYVKFRKNGEVYLDLMNVNRCCEFRDGVLVA